MIDSPRGHLTFEIRSGEDHAEHSVNGVEFGISRQLDI